MSIPPRPWRPSNCPGHREIFDANGRVVRLDWYMPEVLAIVNAEPDIIAALEAAFVVIDAQRYSLAHNLVRDALAKLKP